MKPVRNKPSRAVAAVPRAERISNGIYLDYAATTPVAPEILKAMEPYFGEKYGNAGSLHFLGQEAIAAVDKSRAMIGRAIDAEFDEVIFTGSATEANNFVLRGVIKALGAKPIEPKSLKPKILVSSIEHESVLETARDLGKEGIEAVYLPVDKRGVVDLDKLQESLDERTALVSVMYANNEIGTIQPIAEISRIIKDFNHEIVFHTDAVQAFQYLECSVNNLGVDLMTFSAHKIYGPKGIGALYIRNGVKGRISPVTTGGGQEFGFRSGTENTASIVGFAEAAELVTHSRESESKRVGELRDYFWSKLNGINPKIELNGCQSDVKCQMLPNILNIHFPGHSSENILIKLDASGIAVSSGSACSARSVKPSHVLRALGFSPERVRSGVRFSLGRPTTRDEIDQVLEVLAALS